MSKKQLHLYTLYIYDTYYNPVYHEVEVRAGTLQECKDAFRGFFNEYYYDKWNYINDEGYIGPEQTDEENQAAQKLRDEKLAEVQWFYDLEDGCQPCEEEIDREYFIDYIKTIDLCPETN